MDQFLAPLISGDNSFCVEHYETKHDYCRVTIRLSWPSAKRVITLFAPFLKSIEKSVDIRTAQEIKTERSMERLRLECEERDRKNRCVALNALKKVYRENIDYDVFCKITSYGYGNGYRCSIFERDTYRHYLFYEARRRSIMKMKRKGLSHAQIGKKMGMTKQAISAILRKKARLPRWAKSTIWDYY